MGTRRLYVRAKAIASGELCAPDWQSLMKVSSAQPIGRSFQYSTPHWRLSLRRPSGNATSDFFLNSFCATHGARIVTPKPSFTNSLMADILPMSMTDLMAIFSVRK